MSAHPQRRSAVPSSAPRLYANGQPWRNARGQNAPRDAVEEEYSAEYAVVDLFRDPPRDVFLKGIVREMRIRFYTKKSIKNYRSALTKFLRWFPRSLDQITKEDVREYLELLVNGGASSSQVSVALSAIRTAFDKFCLLRCTVGLVTPRKPKRLPVVLSKQEIQRLLEAAFSYRDKLAISILYGTGLRVSEVSRLAWDDFNFDRRQIRVDQGKGRKDRVVMLAEQLLPLLRQLWKLTGGKGYLFPSEDKRGGRHISTRTIERGVEKARLLAGISKHVTPHQLRHSFATHLIESGTDIRFIQKLLGHTNLETTTLYTKVADTTTAAVSSPLDQLSAMKAHPTSEDSKNLHPPSGRVEEEERRRGEDSTVNQDSDAVASTSQNSVGRMRILIGEPQNADRLRSVTVTIINGHQPVLLPGIFVTEPRAGWFALQIPTREMWEPHLAVLPHHVRERVESPEFYQTLQATMQRRLSRSG